MKKNKRQRLKEEIHKKFKSKCAYCGECVDLKKMEIDHIVPKCDFIMHVTMKHQVPNFLKHLTTDDVEHLDNKNPSCGSCNRFKSSMSLEKFRKELENQAYRAKKYSTNHRLALRYKQIKETPKPIVFYFEKVKK